jgi:hypothetical protein
MSQRELEQEVFVTAYVGTEDVVQERVAVVDEVVSAIVKIAQMPEAELATRISDGELRSLFPFRVKNDKIPALRRFADIQEAPSRALTDEEYEAFMRG